MKSKDLEGRQADGRKGKQEWMARKRNYIELLQYIQYRSNERERKVGAGG